MNSTTLAVVVAVIIAVVALCAAVLIRWQRRRTLRNRFGPEYERTVRTTGAPDKADAILEARTKRVAQFQVRPLSPADRDRVKAQWLRIQKVFVDDPKRAITEADGLIVEVMRARGYPVEDDFDRRADDLSVDHAVVVQPYRAARDIVLRHQRGAATTEDLRQAMMQFRAL